MALTSSTDSPSPAINTPAPYRLDTTAVRIPQPISTAQLLVIRNSIQPRRNWWQFELQTWHYLVSVGSTGIVGAVLIYVLMHGAAR